MCAKCVEELQVYQKALDAADAVSATLKRSCFQSDRKLRDQLANSSDAVPSLIADGFRRARTDSSRTSSIVRKGKAARRGRI
jgi:four helix bundle protein